MVCRSVWCVDLSVESVSRCNIGPDKYMQTSVNRRGRPKRTVSKTETRIQVLRGVQENTGLG